MGFRRDDCSLDWWGMDSNDVSLPAGSNATMIYVFTTIFVKSEYNNDFKINSHSHSPIDFVLYRNLKGFFSNNRKKLHD